MTITIHGIFDPLMEYLLHRTHYHIDRKISGLGNNLYNNTYNEKSHNLDETVAIMHSLVLTKEQLRLLKNIMNLKYCPAIIS